MRIPRSVKEPIRIKRQGDTVLVLSRDVRIKRNNTDWFVHFRADAPANYGLLLSDDALRLLIDFGAGARPRVLASKGDQTIQYEILNRLIAPGFLLSTLYELNGKEARVSLREIMQIRGVINVDDLGLLELECLLIYLLAKENRFKGAICELGSMFGGSTIALALGALKSQNKNKVLAVDDHEWHRHIASGSFPEELARTIPTSLPRFKRNLKTAGVSRQVKILVGDTAQTAQDYEQQVSMLFIDADHSYEGVSRDFQAWFPKLPRGGVVAFHDYGNSNWPAVKMVVDNLLSNFSAFMCYQTLAIGIKG